MRKILMMVIFVLILVPGIFAQSFNNVKAFDDWLYKQRTNTETTPYAVRLNTRDLSGIRGALWNDSKYVSLDLSGSTFTVIGENTGSSFSGCSTLVSVTIGNRVTRIGENAFSGTSLTSIIIPNSVTSIGRHAFESCRITSITLPNSITRIEDFTFRWCRLTSITIPNSVTSIGVDAFHECDSLTSITIGSGVTSIGSGAFTRCSALTSITFQSTISADNFGSNPTLGDLREKYLAGGPGRYTRPRSGSPWTKQ